MESCDNESIIKMKSCEGAETLLKELHGII